jgi:hypothetical protein
MSKGAARYGKGKVRNKRMNAYEVIPRLKDIRDHGCTSRLFGKTTSHVFVIQAHLACSIMTMYYMEDSERQLIN